VEQTVYGAVNASRRPSPQAEFPDEGAMTSGQRRLVQEALARVGYYAGRIDGIFGPETRAAIRRFQHEIGAEMTGAITGAQAARILTWQ
jgi:peptidoglycan hydrolase-like protein with peptidoglycan-binding domain